MNIGSLGSNHPSLAWEIFFTDGWPFTDF